MDWAYYLSAVLVPLDAVAVIFAPSSLRDARRKVGSFGMLALGSGMMVFRIGLLLTELPA
jgi:hypothetical protein